MKKQKKPIESASMENSEMVDEYREPFSKRSLHIFIGNRVIMTNQYEVPDRYKGVIWTVKTNPKPIHGKRCVQLDGYKEPYPVDGLRVVG